MTFGELPDRAEFTRNGSKTKWIKWLGLPEGFNAILFDKLPGAASLLKCQDSMEVDDNRFVSMAPGTQFIHGADRFIKMQVAGSSTPYNAVKLSNGTLYHFNDDDCFVLA